MKPLAIDIFCGLGGWAEGFLAEGWRVVGFDNEWKPYPGEFVMQDVMTLDGTQFKDAEIIVASPPCQAYSYRAMPWKRAKALPPPDDTLFNRCFEIQREASEAAGRYIPLIVENVKGAQKWVGRARWHYGSYYLWGDVPALMPPTLNRRSQKNNGGSWFNVAHNTTSGVNRNPVTGVKHGHNWWADRNGLTRSTSSKSAQRRESTAMVAKIPFPLARHIARVFKPRVYNGESQQAIGRKA